MNNHIKEIEIQNFKSIRELKLTGFKKINLIIGRPNVGKSNFLEALGMHSLNYIRYGNTRNHKFSDIVRIQRLPELFYNLGTNNDKGSIRLQLNNTDATPCLSYNFNNEEAIIELHYYERPASGVFDENYVLREDLSVETIVKDSPYKPVKFYKFNPHFKFHKFDTNFLLPPHGENLASVLSLNPALTESISHWFEPFKLEIDIDLSSYEVKLRKKMNGFMSFSFPYSSIADTLQRIIFHKTAITSNSDSILIFEEPEAHAFPPYISEFTQEVISSETNQFFIVTHSPIIVNDFLENARHDLAIFLADFQDEQTIMHPLTQQQIEEVYQFGVDLFFNNEAYLH